MKQTEILLLCLTFCSCHKLKVLYTCFRTLHYIILSIYNYLIHYLAKIVCTENERIFKSCLLTAFFIPYFLNKIPILTIINYTQNKQKFISFPIKQMKFLKLIYLQNEQNSTLTPQNLFTLPLSIFF